MSQATKVAFGRRKPRSPGPCAPSRALEHDKARTHKQSCAHKQSCTLSLWMGWGIYIAGIVYDLKCIPDLKMEGLVCMFFTFLGNAVFTLTYLTNKKLV